MPPFGLTPTGFVRKNLTDITTELEADQRADIDQNLTFGDEEPLTQLNGTYGEQLAQAWEVLETVAMVDPDGAKDFRLDQISNITGTRRDLDTYSTVILSCVFSGVVNLTAGLQKVRHDSIPTIEFVVLMDYVSPGAGAHDVLFRATVTGPVQAASGTLTDIVVPAAGWLSANNVKDADPGTNRQKDSDLKEKRQRELASGGGASEPTLYSKISRVEGVTSLLLLNNRTRYTDSDGVPSKAVEAIVLGGDDADIAQALFLYASTGAGFHGNTEVEVLDSTGKKHLIKFTRPTEVDVWMTLEIKRNSNYIGETAHKALIAEQSAEYDPGEDVYLSRVTVHGFGLSPEELADTETIRPVTGIIDVRSVLLGTTEPGQTANSLDINPRQIAKYDTSRITLLYVD